MDMIDDHTRVMEFIMDNLKPVQEGKKKFGAVYTPPKLINEMLDRLPDEVWLNPDLKWFDPACGIGNFQVILYESLMKTLAGIIDDTEVRKRHILENMIYVAELDPKSANIYKMIFNSKKYKLNVYQGDFLKMSPEKAFGVGKFDIIIGNPPYQPAGDKASGNTIWQYFVKTSFDILKDDGYITFIHPGGWRKPNTPKGKFEGLFKLMAQDNHMLYLDIHDTKDGMSTFKCGTRYDWYVIKKISFGHKDNCEGRAKSDYIHRYEGVDVAAKQQLQPYQKHPCHR